MLGAVLNDKLTAADHVTTCSSSLYALVVLRNHGLPVSSRQDVFRATVVAIIMYCASAWSGLCSAKDRARLDTFYAVASDEYCADDVPRPSQNCST